ncbi:MAG TPA: hypothetical protein VGL93_05145 [Streptosporangiaceae bacterium]
MTPGEDEQVAPPASRSLSHLLAQRRTLVLRTAAGVVSVLALGGVVTIVRGFAPDDLPACQADCATHRTSDGVAEARPSATPSRTAPARTTAPAPRHDGSRTFAPTVVSEPKRRAPRPTPTPTRRPGWPHLPGHGHWPPRGAWPW